MDQKNPGILKKLLARREASVLIALIVLCVALSLMSPYFLKQRNIFSVLRQISAIAIMAVGQALIIITGGIDLSVGSMLGLMGVLTAVFSTWHLPPVLVFLIVIFCGILMGSINGLLVTKVNITPFIVTIGMMNIARGLSLLITGGMPIHIDSSINFLGGGYLGPIPFSVIIMALIAVLGILFASRTLPGRNVYAVGNNDRAAELSGVRVHRVKIMVYAITGALCALAGIIIGGTLNSADPNSGKGYEMDVIAAVILGGTSLSGGEGTIQGVLIGAALMGVLRNAFVLLGISAYLQIVTIGVVIIGAVAIDSFKTMQSSR
ncbi:MAG: ABC transporter permease [Spirochaetales bacterium]|nr:ABC transporter permease [Spirochaetales bacterium]